MRGILDAEEGYSRREILKAERKAAVALEDRIEMLEAILSEADFKELKTAVKLAPLSELLPV